MHARDYEFKNKLKEARVESRLSQIELGELVGLKGWDISNFEQGKSLPTKIQLEQICDVFNKSVDWFFPTGSPELRPDIRRNSQNSYGHKRSVVKPERKVNPDELDIKLDVEDELIQKLEEPKNEESKKEEPIAIDEKESPVEIAGQSLLVNDNIICSVLCKVMNDIPALRDVVQHLIVASNKYLRGIGDPTLDITIGLSDKNQDDFFHRKIVDKTR
jgi:transcriptional regulator with XRE-family HTH domain